MRCRPHRIIIVSSLLALAGCGSDPAAQEPIKIQPGLYAATLQGRAFGPFFASAPAELQKKICVYPEDVETFPQMYARKYLTMADSCGGDLAERVGNRITGKVSCPLLDAKGVTGSLVTRFEGAVAEQSVDVRALTKLEDMQGAPEDLAEFAGTPLAGEGVELGLRITRIGDCEA